MWSSSEVDHGYDGEDSTDTEDGYPNPEPYGVYLKRYKDSVGHDTPAEQGTAKYGRYFPSKSGSGQSEEFFNESLAINRHYYYRDKQIDSRKPPGVFPTNIEITKQLHNLLP